MQFIRGLYNIHTEHQGCVLTIGNFDGVHLGHHQVIHSLVTKAKQLNLPAVVMLFEPQPQEYFAKQQAPARLTRLRDKYAALQKLGVERLVCIKFNQQFAQLSAQHFIEQILVAKLGVKHLIVGDDFRFGCGRVGDFHLLQQSGLQFGFSVEDTNSYCVEQQRVSSTVIRQALEHDQLELAQSLLGRPYSIAGKVVHGDKQGRKLGFPTANVLLKRLVSPVSGVYVVKVLHQQRIWYGVANIGKRPTVRGVRQQLEVHIFDMQQSLYNQAIEVILLHKLREEQKFNSLDELTAQIAQDSTQAKQYLQQLNK